MFSFSLKPDAAKEEEPVHIINVALKIEKNCKDVQICRKMVYEFTQSKVMRWFISIVVVFVVFSIYIPV